MKIGAVTCKHLALKASMKQNINVTFQCYILYYPTSLFRETSGVFPSERSSVLVDERETDTSGGGEGKKEGRERG